MKQYTIAVLALIGAVDCARLNRDPLLTWRPIPANDVGKNYFVPNFGADSEYTDTMNSIKAAEVVTGKKFISDAEVEKKMKGPSE